ncbi:hypothetical protein A3C09_03470 [Candidatus Uhrbacteria bacterium RIFCSPHIGHO2_02_FULL_47_44]|uniref:Uncharacterized protein n=1 Tax=Candidatus Uhrbacteria bacterium RIFCSPLOWO2_02_FULL_48_18 TaxID=1802408 RepID=A0A1F7V8C2_9BACT|nr:MAG: hypothetical protein A2839_05055 [Candidatus Uhrbacteria bacterium RIFCSPHIGHO2_01_FULL_47_10]OGL71271.1 MAG: hypothetical protein A3C09_03470 [Candidatus Uhrbacteria bacterium RIFCSPHIGHO2_02_FULL_47_44]OGL76085.1 MAG: hypothetical protein A3E97_02300 [Candidatus Uhrbacteria bacterium RIFCSPHIGHO2_12_FULL_47_12]OGL80365.1 MAG: hypothetical protein A3B20_03010 [Candidatus Uhrbacteria bacterium RIFCSPLOWO2_01_FULL_47_17]OGL86224.1 MAG: hypothetical protein A3I41_01500 [Candidatus Uhrbact
MDVGLQSFITFLSILWFFVYWILGGVFFAVMAILRLGRVRKVRFSCLFTIFAAACAFGAAYFGVQSAESAIRSCVVEATSNVQQKVAVIGCGFGGIMGAFFVGALALTLIGFIIMAISKSKAKPWIILDQDEREAHEASVLEEQVSVSDASGVPGNKSKFF